MHLYEALSVRLSVGPSVGRSVGPSVRQSVGLSGRPLETVAFAALRAVFASLPIPIGIECRRSHKVDPRFLPLRVWFFTTLPLVISLSFDI